MFNRSYLFFALFGCIAAVFTAAPAVSAAQAPPALPQIPHRDFSLTEFGAVGDGKTDATPAFTRALAACEKAGGGRVVVPAGRYFVHPFLLVSNLDLHLEKNATLLLSTPPAEYALPDNRRNRQCIEASDCHDVAITGAGVIDGQGGDWWPRYRKTSVLPPGSPPLLHRPYLVVLTRCQRVQVEGVTLTNSPSFHLVPAQCQDVTIRNVRIIAPADAPNTDGIDPSGWNFAITGCTIDVGDDNIALKPSGKIAPDQPSCRHFLIENCTFRHGHGMSIGGQTPGGLENLIVRNCVFEDTQAGIRLKAGRGSGGLSENLTYEHLTMKRVKVPFFITSYYPSIPDDPASDPAQAVTLTTPIWRHIRIRDVRVTDSPEAGRIFGLSEMPVEDIVFTDVHIASEKGFRVAHARGIRFVSSEITVKKKPILDAKNAEVSGIPMGDTSRTITVAPDGSGDCKTVQEAIAQVPDNRPERTVIRLKPGIYQGQIVVPKEKSPVTFHGDDAKTTILTYDRNVNDPIPEGQNPRYRGDGVVIDSDNFEAENLTFRNTSGDHGQAMALRVNADHAVFRHCRLLGWQDTLLCWTGRHYFQDCYIEGRVDFIYGGATAVFDRCEIHSKNGGYVTAASTPQDHPYGFVFLNCHLTGDPAPWNDPTGALPPKPGKSPIMAFLGRPWRPYGAVSFIGCTMDSHIKPEGWNNWGKAENEMTARYSEYNSSGPGANSAARTPWAKPLTAEEVAKYTVPSILGGTDNWNPAVSGTKTKSSTALAFRPDARVKIVLAGDSTVTDQAGWGAGFKALLAPDADCINLSRGGRSSKSFRAEGLWDKTLALKPDYVLIQFGHNDQPGHGLERESDPAAYENNIARYVDDARAAHIIPILVTPLSRRQFGKDGKIHSTLAPYAAAVESVAAEKKVPVIDLQTRSIALYEKLGPDGCNRELAPRKDGGFDGTHLTARGSTVIGRIVAEALRQSVPALSAALRQP